MDLKPTVHFRPESETEIAIWWDFDSELAEIIPANHEAVMEWIVDECGGEEIEGGYFMECDSSVLNSSQHESLGRMVARAVEDYNRPHTVAFWAEIHGIAEAVRLEKVYWGQKAIGESLSTKQKRKNLCQ